MQSENKKIWFKSKRYIGWGWYPATWQGWLILAVYLILAISLAAHVPDDTASIGQVVGKFLLPLFALTGLLIFVCYKTGEKPVWHWLGKPLGGKKEE